MISDNYIEIDNENGIEYNFEFDASYVDPLQMSIVGDDGKSTA